MRIALLALALASWLMACSEDKAKIECFLDLDGDGVGDTLKTVGGTRCEPPFAPIGGDCDDDDPEVRPELVRYPDCDGDGLFVANGVAGCPAVTPCADNRPPAAWSLTPPSTSIDCDDSDADRRVDAPWFADCDGDGYRAPFGVRACGEPAVRCGDGQAPDGGWDLKAPSETSADCDDEDADAVPTQVWYPDCDGDGAFAGVALRQCLEPLSACSDGAPPTGGWTHTVPAEPDCDDEDPTLEPGLVWYADCDGDGHAVGTPITACEPAATCKAWVHDPPNVPDCDDGDALEFPGQRWYPDCDDDGWFSGTVSIACVAPATACADSQVAEHHVHEVPVEPDCDDEDATRHPGLAWFYDCDGDDAWSTTSITSCRPPTLTPCDDGQAPDGGYTLEPSASDCDDELASAATSTVWYADCDGDTRAGTAALASCGPPDHQPSPCVGAAAPLGGWVSEAPLVPDCDDQRASATDPQVYYADCDGDHVASGAAQTSCGAPTSPCNDGALPDGGFTLVAPALADCDDEDATAKAAELWYADCDGDHAYDDVAHLGCGQPASPCNDGALPDGGWTTTAPVAPDCNDEAALYVEVRDWFADCDDDGATPALGITSCGQPASPCKDGGVPDGGWSNSASTLADCNDDDDDVVSLRAWYPDCDGDAAFAQAPITSCGEPASPCASGAPRAWTNEAPAVPDCDDSLAAAAVVQSWYADCDGDGVPRVDGSASCGEPASPCMAAAPPSGGWDHALPLQPDCDDDNAGVALGQLWYADCDGDNARRATPIASCGTPSVALSPCTDHLAPDGGYATTAPTLADCNDEAASSSAAQLWYGDCDNDGLRSATPVTSCGQPATTCSGGWSTSAPTSADCNDASATATVPKAWFADCDGDGAYRGSPVVACAAPASPCSGGATPIGGFTTTTPAAPDCNDSVASVKLETTWFADCDKDGASGAGAVIACGPPTTSTCAGGVMPTWLTAPSNPLDCNDNDQAKKTLALTYPDCDGDHAFGTEPILACGAEPATSPCAGGPPVGGYAASPLAFDCDDADASVAASAVHFADCDGDGAFNAIGIADCGAPVVSRCSDGLAPDGGYTTTAPTLATSDCNDENASLKPGQLWYADCDNDLAFRATALTSCAEPPTSCADAARPDGGWTHSAPVTPDCDDESATRKPGQSWYRDCDSDGAFTATATVSCLEPAGCAATATSPTTPDCDDADALEKPGQKWYADCDGDGAFIAAALTQCLRPTACGAYSNSAPASPDCNDGDGAQFPGQLWYPDCDGDNAYAFEPDESCAAPADACLAGAPAGGFTHVLPAPDVGDCDDTRNDVFPNQKWYADCDGDGAMKAAAITSCAPPATACADAQTPDGGWGHSAPSTPDCDDESSARKPGRAWFADCDHDLAYTSTSTVSCLEPNGTCAWAITPGSDCDDADPAEKPGQSWYPDCDNDTFNSTTAVVQCLRPTACSSYSDSAPATPDCNDADATQFPGKLWYGDCDDDGARTGSAIASCAPPAAACAGGYAGTAPTTPDCDDADPIAKPGQLWFADCDNDGAFKASGLTSCNAPATACADAQAPDGGWAHAAPTTPDCDDESAARKPGRAWYADCDHDLAYTSTSTSSCLEPNATCAWSITQGADCDDADPAAKPGQSWFPDCDNDTYYSTTAVVQCLRPSTCASYATTTPSTPDCNDGDGAQFPGKLWYGDCDNDTFRNPLPVASCTTPAAACAGGWSGSAPSAATADCNDGDAALKPGQLWFADCDDDTYFKATSISACLAPASACADAQTPDGGWSHTTPATPDCDDESAARKPGRAWFPDCDKDLVFGASATTSCLEPNTTCSWAITAGSDCDDADAAEKPGQTWYADCDGDTWFTGTAITQCLRPSACASYANGAPAVADCNDAAADQYPNKLWYGDCDDDTYRNPLAVVSCGVPTGACAGGWSGSAPTAANADCDDASATHRPGQLWYPDCDHDLAFTSSSSTSCFEPNTTCGWSTTAGNDCDDTNAAAKPNQTWYRDCDDDGFYGGSALTQCLPPGSCDPIVTAPSAASTDCNDSDATEFPGQVWTPDCDHDLAYATTTTVSCDKPNATCTWLANARPGIPTDCDDNDPDAYTPCGLVCGCGDSICAGDTCVACARDADCPADAPICDANDCVACLGEGDCAAGETCNSDGECVTCASDDCIKKGLIVAWPGSVASIPTGWVICDGTNGTPDLRGRFARATSSSEALGTTGGAATHDHGTLGSTTLTTGSAGSSPTCGVSSGGTSWIQAATDHTHSYTHGHTVSAASNLPPYRDVIFIMKKTGGAAPPDGVVLALDQVSALPDGWELADDVVDLRGRYLRGAAAGVDGGGTGGALTHDHGGATNQDTTSFAVGSIGPNNFAGNAGVGCGTSAEFGHTHNYPHAHALSASNNEPPYRTVAFVQADGALEYPVGAVALWYGTSASIPSGWHRATWLDGKFLKGATSIAGIGTEGGATTHNHGGVTATDGAGTSSTTTNTNSPSGSNQRQSTAHTHSVAAHSHTIAAATHLPPYIAVQYITRSECVSDCSGKTCGDDGCGGSCGTCGSNRSCNAAGTCDAEPDWTTATPGFPAGTTMGRIWSGERGTIYVWTAATNTTTGKVDGTLRKVTNSGASSSSILTIADIDSGAMHVWGAGPNEIYTAVYTCPSNSGCSAKARVDRWDGTSWVQQTLPGNYYPRDIKGTSNDVWLRVDQGAVHYTGGAWTHMSVPARDGGSGFGNLVPIAADNVYALDCWGHARWNGASWAGSFNSWAFCDVADAWGMRANGPTSQLDLYVVGGSNFAPGVRIYRFIEGSDGSNSGTWGTSQSSAVFADPPIGSGGSNCGYANEVWGAGTGEVWVSGTFYGSCVSPTNVGRVYRYDGSSWARVITPYDNLPTITGIWGTAKDDVWFALADGRLMHYGQAAANAPTLADTGVLAGSLETNAGPVYDGTRLVMVNNLTSSGRGRITTFSLATTDPIATGELGSTTQMYDISASGTSVFTVGYGVPSTCGTADGVGGTESKGAFAGWFPETLANTSCVGANFFSYRGYEGYESTTAFGSRVYAGGSGELTGGSGRVMLGAYNTSGALQWKRYFETGAGNLTGMQWLDNYLFLYGNHGSVGRLIEYDAAAQATEATSSNASAGTPKTNVVVSPTGVSTGISAHHITSDGSFLYVVNDYGSPSNKMNVVKYGPAGNAVWNVSYDGLGVVTPEELVAAYGRVFAIGTTDRGASGLGGKDIYIAMIDESTGALLDTKYWGGAQNDFAGGGGLVGRVLYVSGYRAGYTGGENGLVLLKYLLD